MKITKQQLKQIIKEELEAALSEKRHIRDVDGYAKDVMEPQAVTFEGFKAWLEKNPEYVPLSAEYPAQGTPVTARWADAAPAWWVKEK